MVDLLEAQAREIKALQRAIRNLEGRLEVLCHLDAVVADQLRDPLEDVERILEGLGREEGSREEGSREEGSPNWQEGVERALAQVRSLTGLVSELATPQQVGPASVDRSRLVTVPLDGVVEQALSMVVTSLDRNRVDVDLPPGFMITTAPRRLVWILSSLFENAASCDVSEPIECRAEVTGEWLRIEVADRGPALDDIDLKALLESLPDEEGCVATRSSGMYLVRMLARSLDGDATIVDRPGGGAVAWVQLPQRRGTDISTAAAEVDALSPFIVH